MLDETLMGQVDVGDVPLNDLQRSIVDAIKKFYAEDPVLSIMPVNTARDAKEFLKEAEKLRHRRPAPDLSSSRRDYDLS